MSAVLDSVLHIQRQYLSSAALSLSLQPHGTQSSGLQNSMTLIWSSVLLLNHSYYLLMYASSRLFSIYSKSNFAESMALAVFCRIPSNTCTSNLRHFSGPQAHVLSLCQNELRAVHLCGFLVLFYIFKITMSENDSARRVWQNPIQYLRYSDRLSESAISFRSSTYILSFSQRQTGVTWCLRFPGSVLYPKSVFRRVYSSGRDWSNPVKYLHLKSAIPIWSSNSRSVFFSKYSRLRPHVCCGLVLFNIFRFLHQTIHGAKYFGRVYIRDFCPASKAIMYLYFCPFFQNATRKQAMFAAAWICSIYPKSELCSPRGSRCICSMLYIRHPSSLYRLIFTCYILSFGSVLYF